MSHPDELASVCDNPALKAKLGVGADEVLMIAIHWHEDGEPEDVAALIANRLNKPTVVIDFQDHEVLAFERPRHSEKRACKYEFNQDGLALLIRALREVDIDAGDEQLMQSSLLEHLEKELLRRFGTYVEDFDAEDGEQAAWAEREMAEAK